MPEVSLARIASVARFGLVLLLPGLLAVCAVGQSKGLNAALPLVHEDHGRNSSDAQSKHYVVVVSLNGFRWDFVKRDNDAHLLSLAKEGAWAPEGMLPGYPAFGFSNGYSIATGLYPGQHGIVAEEFEDPVKQAHFSVADRAAVADGAWYGGTPLWSRAEKVGMRTACIFWPGSEAEIAGFRPTWYAEISHRAISSQATEQAQIDNAVALLRLPAEERPHLIFMSFLEADAQARQFGLDSAQARVAIRRMDTLIGKLKAGFDATKLPINLVVVSDRGTVAAQGGWITLDQLADLKGFDTQGNLLYAQDEADRVRVYNQLKKASSQFMVYRLKNAPAELNLGQNARAGDPAIIATGPFAIRAHGPASGKPDQPPSAGIDGLDARKVPEMKAIFIAAGPDIVSGKTVAPFENVNLYPWLAHMLGLAPAKNDGSLNILAGTLRDGGNDPGGDTGK
jgi:predicted AlkP superfamily pyrophosphatase or phosphodiesterase